MIFFWLCFHYVIYCLRYLSSIALGIVPKLIFLNTDFKKIKLLTVNKLMVVLNVCCHLENTNILNLEIQFSIIVTIFQAATVYPKFFVLFISSLLREVKKSWSLWFFFCIILAFMFLEMFKILKSLFCLIFDCVCV